ncbi:SoxR reducing system RseC family protein [Rheinheimera sp. WS51]|uniref:SoxR reducing system RseC family protein n=1 Tax=Rheinheimera sp. WS51 TaxID=3425886 RepID=UPI003D8C4E6F
MIEQLASVVAVDTSGVWLTTTPVSSCNACNVSDDCGTGIVAKTLTPRQHRFFVSTSLSLLPGEQVKIAVSEQNLLQAAFVVYLLPLVLMLLSALYVSNGLQLTEGWVMLAALLGASIGFFIARRFSLWQQTKTEQIHIIQVLPELKIHPA